MIAKIGGVTYSSTAIDSQGRYGYSPVFQVPADDPDTPAKEGGVAGDTVSIYVAGVLATTTTFQNGVVAQLNLSIPKLDQTITFGALATKTYGDADFTVSATASSGLAVTFTASGNCTVTGNTVHITGAGSGIITAHQAGNANYNAAPDVPQTFTINKATPTATLGVSNSPVTYDGATHSATVGVTASSTPGTVANVQTGGAANQTNAGTYAVTADFVPNDSTNYNSLTGVSAGNFVIDKANQTITFGALATKTYGDADFTVSATASSGLAVTFIASGNCTVSGNTVHITGAGSGTITVQQAGNANYNAAPDVPQTFTINNPSGGGGGGGGFGNQLIGINLSGNSPWMDGNGKSVTAGAISTPDGKLTLSIPVGVFIWNAAGAAQPYVSSNTIDAPPAVPSGQKLIKCFELGPSGVTFNPAISVIFNYTSADLSGGVSESSLYIAWWNGTAWVQLTSTVDATAKTVTAAITHFTTFGLFAQTVPATTVPPTTTLPPTTTVPSTATTTPPPTTTVPPPATTTAPTTQPPDQTKPNWLIPMFFVGAALLLGIILFARSQKK
ncbi:hypothetical protein DEALK_02660 [Dehalogenimonas alkenigignens]|uniref:MBG domain-containing protein n=1 Tax=Dehalogenimonas alkenigignens TaxID=1217799 RepID=A0A0W0GLA6_9CHLR|nr:hypothetical protein DEALK_02660 [Dehalogenimonas alkenigignens]